MAKEIVPATYVLVKERRNAVLLCLWDRNTKFIAVPKENCVVETIVVMFAAKAPVVQMVQVVVAVDVVVQKVQDVVEGVVVQENAVMLMESV